MAIFAPNLAGRFAIRQLFAKKTIAQITAETNSEKRLHRVLGRWHLFGLGVGAIIGAGIFVLTGLAAREHAGPALTIAFVVAGFGCACAALCYAEFAAMVPVAGSAYTYAYATLGEFVAWIIGWDLILEYAMASSAVAVGWSKYVVEFLKNYGLNLPPTVYNDPQTYAQTVGALSQGDMLKDAGFVDSLQMMFAGQLPFAINWVAIGILAVVTIILIKGIRESATFNTTIVFIKLFVVLMVIALGAPYVETNNWIPYMPFGWKGVFSAAAYVFFAYIGFDAVSTQAEEAKNPQKDLPFGIIGSLIFCTILYIAVSAVLTGMVRYDAIDINAPIATAFSGRGLDWAARIISVGAIAGLTSVLLVLVLGQTRVFLAMARDRLLPYTIFGKVHPKFRTPANSTLITGVVIMIVAGLTPINKIAEMVNIGTLLAFVIVCVAVIVLRYREPAHSRPFRCPWFPLVPILGIISNLVMMFSLSGITWARLMIWLVIGFVIYFAYGYRHSLFRKKNLL